MSEKLTSGALRAIACAREEARRLNHAFLGTEHFLVGIARARAEGAREVLACTGLDDVERLRGALEGIAGRSPIPPPSVYLPLTARARASLERAAVAARDLRRPRIAAVHVLHGVLADPESAACAVIALLGINLGHVRGELLDTLRRQVTDAVPEPETEACPPPRPVAAIPVARLVEVPLLMCPRGHGPMEKLREEGLEIGICSECSGTFVPAGQLHALLSHFIRDAAS